MAKKKANLPKGIRTAWAVTHRNGSFLRPVLKGSIYYDDPLMSSVKDVGSDREFAFVPLNGRYRITEVKPTKPLAGGRKKA